MDTLLIWYFACAIGFGISVYARTKPEKKKRKVRVIAPWLSNIYAYSEHIEGYEDPIFQTAPMELERDAASTKKH
jgi:hypothetical protein